MREYEYRVTLRSLPGVAHNEDELDRFAEGLHDLDILPYIVSCTCDGWDEEFGTVTATFWLVETSTGRANEKASDLFEAAIYAVRKGLPGPLIHASRTDIETLDELLIDPEPACHLFSEDSIMRKSMTSAFDEWPTMQEEPARAEKGPCAPHVET